MEKLSHKETIHAAGLNISLYSAGLENEFISLTDMARYRSIKPAFTVHNWLKSRDVVDFLGLWESLNNPGFKVVDFDNFKENAGTNAFVFSIKEWTDNLNAIGLFTKSGRYGGGIYAHIDIAFEFASWLSPEFKLYIIQDYKRLKSSENKSLNWNLNREIAKLNYPIHTDAIKNCLIVPDLTPEQITFKYANEADLLNVALFGITAKQWKDANPASKGNIRDDANLNQLLVLANMESYNAILIEQGKPMSERLVLLRNLAIKQMNTLSALDTNRFNKLHD
jgi:hypothetical protein